MAFLAQSLQQGMPYVHISYHNVQMILLSKQNMASHVPSCHVAAVLRCSPRPSMRSALMVADGQPWLVIKMQRKVALPARSSSSSSIAGNAMTLQIKVIFLRTCPHLEDNSGMTHQMVISPRHASSSSSNNSSSGSSSSSTGAGMTPLTCPLPVGDSAKTPLTYHHPAMATTSSSRRGIGAGRLASPLRGGNELSPQTCLLLVSGRGAAHQTCHRPADCIRSSSSAGGGGRRPTCPLLVGGSGMTHQTCHHRDEVSSTMLQISRHRDSDSSSSSGGAGMAPLTCLHLGGGNGMIPLTCPRPVSVTRRHPLRV
jgi:hypothetical protein